MRAEDTAGLPPAVEALPPTILMASSAAARFCSSAICRPRAISICEGGGERGRREGREGDLEDAAREAEDEGSEEAPIARHQRPCAPVHRVLLLCFAGTSCSGYKQAAAEKARQAREARHRPRESRRGGWGCRPSGGAGLGRRHAHPPPPLLYHQACGLQNADAACAQRAPPCGAAARTQPAAAPGKGRGASLRVPRFA